ncbi:MAG: hypothetical protein ACI4WP_00430 [Bacilli bacterium]
MTNESISIDQIAVELNKNAETIRNLAQGKDAAQLIEFVDAVVDYAKFIDNTIELEKAADKALQGLIDLKK